MKISYEDIYMYIFFKSINVNELPRTETSLMELRGGRRIKFMRFRI